MRRTQRSAVSCSKNLSTIYSRKNQTHFNSTIVRQQSRFIRIATQSRSWIRFLCADWQNVCRAGKRRYSTPPVAEWQAHSAHSQRNTISQSRSPSDCSTKSTINRQGRRSSPQAQVVAIKSWILQKRAQNTWRSCLRKRSRERKGECMKEE